MPAAFNHTAQEHHHHAADCITKEGKVPRRESRFLGQQPIRTSMHMQQHIRISFVAKPVACMGLGRFVSVCPIERQQSSHGTARCQAHHPHSISFAPALVVMRTSNSGNYLRAMCRLRLAEEASCFDMLKSAISRKTTAYLPSCSP